MYPILLDSSMTPSTRKDSIDFHYDYPTHGLPLRKKNSTFTIHQIIERFTTDFKYINY